MNRYIQISLSYFIIKLKFVVATPQPFQMKIKRAINEPFLPWLFLIYNLQCQNKVILIKNNSVHLQTYMPKYPSK